MSAPFLGSLLTAIIVLALTFGFWGLWAWHIGSFSNVPKEPGPRAIIVGGILVALAFTFMFMNTPAGRVIIPIVLGVAIMTVWIVAAVKWKQFHAVFTRSVFTRSVVIACFFLALVLVILSNINFDLQEWATMKPTKCCEYCEARHLCRDLATQEWVTWRKHAPEILQPSNAWSNMLFLLVGFLVVAARPKEPLAWAFAIVASSLAIGSFLFHSSLTGTWHQSMDVAGIYGVLLAVVVYGLERLMSSWDVVWPGWLRWLIAALVVAISFAFIPLKVPFDNIQFRSEYIMGFFFVLILVLSILHLCKTFNKWGGRVVDHPAAHETATAFLPIFLLLASVIVRHQDMFTGDIQKLTKGAALCPVATDYGYPLLGLIPVLGVFGVIAAMALVINHWYKRRQSTGSSNKADYIPALLVTLVALPIYGLMFVLLLVFSYSSCREAGWFNGHTWWHILTASALYLQWRYYDHHQLGIRGEATL